MTILYVLLAIVLLGVLITVHEFGHFIAARATGIAVKEFSIGFGPKLLQWKSRKLDTVFTLRPIPMGGSCMFYGDTDDDPDGTKVADDPRNYNKAPVWKRILSVLSGPLMNFVLAFVVAIVLMACYGVTVAQPSVAAIESGMPAEAAGLQSGDVFVSVDGTPIRVGDVNAISEAIDRLSPGESLPLTVRRGDAELPITLTPSFDEAQQRYRIGVSIIAYAPMPSGEYISGAWNQCVYSATAILDALGKLFTTGEGFDQTAGPVGVVQIVAEQTQKGGLETFLLLLVMISINLGLFNLIPIPGLDGSRIVFMLIEAIRRKPVSQKIEATVHLCGYVLLIGLMIFFTFRDVGRIFGVS